MDLRSSLQAGSAWVMNLHLAPNDVWGLGFRICDFRVSPLGCRLLDLEDDNGNYLGPNGARTNPKL